MIKKKTRDGCAMGEYIYTSLKRIIQRHYHDTRGLFPDDRVDSVHGDWYLSVVLLKTDIY